MYVPEPDKSKRIVVCIHQRVGAPIGWALVFVVHAVRAAVCGAGVAPADALAAAEARAAAAAHALEEARALVVIAKEIAQRL